MNKTRPWTAIYPVNMWVLIISLQTFLTQFWPYTSLCGDYIISPLKFVGKYFNLLVEEGGGMVEWLLETAGGNKRWGFCPPSPCLGDGVRRRFKRVLLSSLSGFYSHQVSSNSFYGAQSTSSVQYTFYKYFFDRLFYAIF